MPTQLQNRSMMLLLLVTASLVLTAFAFGISNSGLSAETAADRTGRLDVDGVSYTFAPTTCTITDSDFLAAGSGEISGETFWISASRDNVNLTVGPDSDLVNPADTDLWLSSVDTVDWDANGNTITAAPVMQDQRANDSPHFRAALTVACPSA